MDVGRVEWGLQMVGFELNNCSGEEIQILEVRKHCTCSKVQIPTTSTPDAGTIRGSLAWDTKGLKGQATTSISLVYVRKSAPHKEQFAIVAFKAQVEPGFILEPDSLTFDESKSDSQSLLLTSHLDCHAEIISVNVPHPSIHCQIDDSRRRVHVEFDHLEWSHGMIQKLPLTFEVANSKMKCVTFPITISSSKKR